MRTLIRSFSNRRATREGIVQGVGLGQQRICGRPPFTPSSSYSEEFKAKIVAQILPPHIQAAP